MTESIFGQVHTKMRWRWWDFYPKWFCFLLFSSSFFTRRKEKRTVFARVWRDIKQRKHACMVALVGTWQPCPSNTSRPSHVGGTSCKPYTQSTGLSAHLSSHHKHERGGEGREGRWGNGRPKNMFIGYVWELIIRVHTKWCVYCGYIFALWKKKPIKSTAKGIVESKNLFFGPNEREPRWKGVCVVLSVAPEEKFRIRTMIEGLGRGKGGSVRAA